jgi:RimJ/RimL family protein N-acetyltransferase
LRIVRARTAPANRASSRVLEKIGFALRGEVIDPHDGLLVEWELRR